MQPESPTPSPTLHITSHPTSTDSNAQHGLHSRPDTVSLPSAADAGAVATISAEQHALDAALAASLQEPAAVQSNELRRLSRKTTPSPPARNRVTEYEQALTPPVLKQDGPGFEVIKKYRNPGDKRSPIQELPNEVLIHALALLAPTDLTSISLVSKRFHDLVTGPHAWRSAFAHFFPGPDSVQSPLKRNQADLHENVTPTGKRAFTRLSALASWRSEYVLRTRLLRSLYRGKPIQPASSTASPRSSNISTAAPTIAYNSSLFTTINHLHGVFSSSSSKRLPRFIHAADDTGSATSSDPASAKVDNWGLSDPSSFLQFAERFPGDAQYGLGPGEIVGVPNVMDVSQPYGMVHGEGSPGGMTYYRSTEEMRGRFLTFSSAMSVPELGIPKVASTHEAVTSVWIAKSQSIPALTEGLIGILSGSSSGVLTAYSLGALGGHSTRDQRFARGEMTARWVLSPGVPIIAIAVDNEYSHKRYIQNRIWAIVLNALGEVYYLTKFPRRPHVERGARPDDESTERTAWLAGRGVYWSLVESSRRAARPDPYGECPVDGSYSPRSSWNGMCLSPDQVRAETREIESFIARKPRDFQKACIGWDMRRKLDVDFAGDDGNHAGENVIVIECGLDDGSNSGVKRYSRCRTYDRSTANMDTPPSLTSASTGTTSPLSLFGVANSPILTSAPGLTLDRLEDSLSRDDLGGSATPRPMSEQWRVSQLLLGGLRNVQITASAIDLSQFATLTTSEDPLLNFSSKSNSSSPTDTPLSPTMPSIATSADVPGQRARMFAVGTKLGTVIVWDIRAPLSRVTDSATEVEPIRIIHTDSPGISCLALTSLYLVHGGNDGLVQAWDPLASTMQPIRTLNSKFISRARRRLIQNAASPQGIGINLFAAGALCLDPDPTVLRGMVSLGLQLFYWSYSSSAADQYKSQKRQLHRSERGSNNGGERFSGASQSNLKDYIANEKFELERERQQRRKEAERFAGRFGTELLGGSEDEMLAYAALLSQESLEEEARRRASDASTVVSSTAPSASGTSDITPAETPSPRMSSPKTEDELDADIAEAIRQSLATSPGRSAWDIPIKHAKPKGRKGSSAKHSPRPSPPLAGSSRGIDMTDLDYALQLSLAEEQSKLTMEIEDFPSLSSSPRNGRGKGKGRSR